MNYFEDFGISFLGRTPYVLAWFIGIVFAVYMVRKNGGKAEKVLLAGCSLMFFTQAIASFLTAVAHWMVYEREMPIVNIGWVVSLPTGVLSMTGIICLVYAYFIKFMGKENRGEGS